jgi:hypothetical protein
MWCGPVPPWSPAGRSPPVRPLTDGLSPDEHIPVTYIPVTHIPVTHIPVTARRREIGSGR